MSRYYPFFLRLPGELIFIDSCAFCHCGRYVGSRNNVIDWSNPSENLADVARLECLIDKLSGMDNWVVTKQVREEFEQGNFKLRELIADPLQSRLKSSRTNLLRVKERAYQLISEEVRDAVSPRVMTREEFRIMRGVTSLVRGLFVENGGVLKPPYTDVKLISAATAYAASSPVYIFSHDKALRRTVRAVVSRLTETGKDIIPIGLIMEDHGIVSTPITAKA